MLYTLFILNKNDTELFCFFLKKSISHIPFLFLFLPLSELIFLHKTPLLNLGTQISF